MDPRSSARQPGPGFASSGTSHRLPPASDEPQDEWMIGVSDTPPWELSGGSERPPALPAEQPAPWAAARQPQPPWAPVSGSAPWDADETESEDSPSAAAAPSPVSTDTTPWDRPSSYGPAAWDAQRDAETPWDAPAPFSVDDGAQDRDPYDADAPIAADVFQDPRPAVIGSAQALELGAEPPCASAEVEPTQPSEWTEREHTYDSEDAFETVEALGEDHDPEPEQARDPLEWPPIPTDLQLKPKVAEPAAPPDPLEWPPIPTDLFRQPAWQPPPNTQPQSSPATTGLWAEPAEERPDRAAGDADAEVAIVDEDELELDGSYESVTTTADDHDFDDRTHAGSRVPAEPADSVAAVEPSESADDTFAGWAMAEQAAFVAQPVFVAQPADQPESRAAVLEAPAVDDAEDDDWLLESMSAEEEPATPTPPATWRQPASSTLDQAGEARAGERADEAWFLADESPGVRGADVAKSVPSSTQTAVVTVLVAAAVIGLVIVFLLLFTSVFG